MARVIVVAKFLISLDCYIDKLLKMIVGYRNPKLRIIARLLLEPKT